MSQTAVVRIPTQDPWALSWQSFILDLDFRGKSRHTVVSYEAAGRHFHTWLLDNQRATDPDNITRADIQ